MSSSTAERNKIAKILYGAYLRKKSSSPHYSQSALARDVGVTPAFMTNILKGKKIPPLKRLDALCKRLELDVAERAYLTKVLVLKPGAKDTKKYQELLGDHKILNRKIAEKNNSNFLSKWWNVAILEGLTLQPPYNTATYLKKSLRLTQKQWDEAIECLRQADLVVEENGELKKKDLHTYFSSGRTKKEFRDFHEQWILKAREQLLNKTSDEDFKKRLITGFTFAMNSDLTEEMKKKIMDFLDDLSSSASAGECSEVYQCNIQFFPLVKKED